jgi:hypothetical protein
MNDSNGVVTVALPAETWRAILSSLATGGLGQLDAKALSQAIAEALWLQTPLEPRSET